MKDFVVGVLVVLFLISFYRWSILGQIRKIRMYGDKAKENQNILQQYAPVFLERFDHSKSVANDLQWKIEVFERELQAKIYLTVDLTLEMLAEKTSIPANQLSQLFAKAYQANFNKIINRHRIKHAVELLNHQDKAYQTIDQIGIQSGFNSRSSFYRAFKDSFNMTPSQYKQQQH